LKKHVQRLLAGVFSTQFAGGLLVRRAYQAQKWFNDDLAYHAPTDRTQGYRATALQTQGAWASRINVIFAGLASEFAVGTKVPFVLAALAIGVWILLKQSIALAERLRRAMLFDLSVATIGSYWYIRNWIVTGNPLFPGKIGSFQ
jgi:hypothetical protein